MQEGLFCAGWLIAAALLREEREATLCFCLYGLLEIFAVDGLTASASRGGMPEAWAVSAALLSGCAANVGIDSFVNQRPRHWRLWLSLAGLGIALQFLAPGVLDLLVVRSLGFDIVLLLQLAAPLALIARPLQAEFGRFGLLALAPGTVFALFVAFVVARLLLVPGAIEALAQHRASADSTALLPAVVSSGLFHLTWLALVVGRQVARARRLARFDFLTGLLQRAPFEGEALQALALARRTQQCVSLAFLDVDLFKSINDAGGHGAGDEVLRQFARLLREQARASDCVGRWGGEEFVLLMPDTDAAGARTFLDRLQQRIAQAAIAVPPGCAALTASIGVASWLGENESFPSLVARADNAMYAAKRQQRGSIEDAAPALAFGTKPLAAA